MIEATQKLIQIKAHGEVTRILDLESFFELLKDDDLAVGDELITEDIDGKAIFQVADIRKKSVYMVRKFLLEGCKPMKDDDFDLISWLNTTYIDTLPGALTARMKRRENDLIFLPREKEVFGETRYSDPEEKGKQWEIFKKTKQRIRLIGSRTGAACYWWESSPHISNSTSFCVVSSAGTAAGSGAGPATGVLPCFRIAR